MPNKIHRRVYIFKKHDEELDSLRLVRGRTDEVIVQERDDDTFFIQPNDLKGISIYDGCSHGDGFVTLPLTADIKAVRKEYKNHNVNNTMTNNTNFCLNVFLNETCKNAINLDLFLKNLIFEMVDPKLMIGNYVTCH